LKTIIHIHQARIRGNIKSKVKLPPIILRTYKGVQYANSIKVNGPVEFIYSPDKPLKCGARLYCQCDSNDIEVLA
jgi:hypothetical protein